MVNDRGLKIETDLDPQMNIKNLKESKNDETSLDKQAMSYIRLKSLQRLSNSPQARSPGQVQSPVAKYISQNSDFQLKDKLKGCFIRAYGQEQQPLMVVDWCKTLLYDYYILHKNQLDKVLLKRQQVVKDSWDSHYYMEEELEALLTQFRESFTDLAQQNIFGPIYMRALLTLKFLFNEQAIEQSKFQKLRELYGEVTIENTVKFLIRCQILFSSRFDLLQLFRLLDEFESKSGKVLGMINSR